MQYTNVILYRKEKEGRITLKEEIYSNRILPVAIVTLQEDVTELEDLAKSMSYHVAYEVLQRRDRPQPKSFVGKGKLKELKELLEVRPVGLLIFNGYLKPSQHLLLERELNIECVDRVRLILNIFSTRAFSREAQLQVHRAKLIYEIPLLREWIHNAKSGEHPGFLGAGEYETDAYYELIRRQLSRIDAELKKLETDHSNKRKQRRKKGFNLVAIAGYTNAGKSTLLNALTTEKALVEDRLFSTLSTTTGRMEGESKQILITDTIGFLSNLPHFMIESFKSTIDEAYFADLVLLVVDCSDSIEDMRRKLETSREVLFPEVDPHSLVLVLSKKDLASDIPAKVRMTRDVVPTREVIVLSSATGEGVKELRRIITATFEYPVEMSFRLPHVDGVNPFLSWLHAHTEVVQVKYGEEVEVHLFSQEKDHSRIVNNIVALGGSAIQ
jgi:GTPase